MAVLYANDGRILTPPKNLEPLLKNAFPAFFALIGHIRFFYVADEIWDGRASLVFNAGGETLVAFKLDDGAFDVNIAGKDFRIIDEKILSSVYSAIKQAASDSQRRPEDQLAVDLNEYPSGIRCDLCQLNRLNNVNDFSGCERFHVMTRHCYFGVEDDWGETEFSTNTCAGKADCYTKTLACLKEKKKKGIHNCLECGEYRTCRDCGVGHDPGECNLGITAEEVTCLIIPYCEVERLNYIKEGK